MNSARPRRLTADAMRPAATEFMSRRQADVERWILAYLRHAPLSLCLREVNRLLAMEILGASDPGAPRSPVLDVGCGDGFWWTQRDIGAREVYGIDLSADEVRQAARHIRASVCNVATDAIFPETRFREIVGNCSLEHVRDIDGALRNLRACATDDARFVLFVPAVGWAYQGKTQSYLLKHQQRIAMTISGALNGFFQHWHLYDTAVWTRLLQQNGWNVVAVYGLGNERSEFLFRLFLLSSLAAFTAKSITSVYPNRLLRTVPDGLLAPLRDLVMWAVRDPVVDEDHPAVYEYMILAEPQL